MNPSFLHVIIMCFFFVHRTPASPFISVPTPRKTRALNSGKRNRSTLRSTGSRTWSLEEYGGYPREVYTGTIVSHKLSRHVPLLPLNVQIIISAHVDSRTDMCRRLCSHWCSSVEKVFKTLFDCRPDALTALCRLVPSA